MLFVDREPRSSQTIHLEVQINRLGQQIVSTTSILVRISHLWPIINHTNTNQGTAFICFNLEVFYFSLSLDIHQKQLTICFSLRDKL